MGTGVQADWVCTIAARILSSDGAHPEIPRKTMISSAIVFLHFMKVAPLDLLTSELIFRFLPRSLSVAISEKHRVPSMVISLACQAKLTTKWIINQGQSGLITRFCEDCC